MEEMMEITFPSRMHLTQISDLWFNYYWETDVDEWFKRCVEDIPVIRLDPTKEDMWKHIVDVQLWFEKWFSQFIEKGDKDGI